MWLNTNCNPNPRGREGRGERKGGGGDKNAIAPIYNQSGVSGQCIGKEKLIAIEL